MYYSACLRQEILGHLTLAGGHRLQSRFSPAVYLWLVISGMLATIFTLTLAYPWARAPLPVSGAEPDLAGRAGWTN